MEQVEEGLWEEVLGGYQIGSPPFSQCQPVMLETWSDGAVYPHAGEGYTHAGEGYTHVGEGYAHAEQVWHC
jgi:hypothetical protein